MKRASIIMSLILTSSVFAGEIANSFFSSDKKFLIGHWTFNETSGTTARDISGNGNNGTLTNGCSFVSSKNGNAVSGGTSGGNQYVDFGNPASNIFNVDYATPFIVGCAYKRPYTSILGGADVVLCKTNWTGNYGWQLKAVATASTARWQLCTRGNTGDTVNGDARTFNVLVPTSTFDNSLHTVILIYDGKNTLNSWTLFQDSISDKGACTTGDCIIQGSLGLTQSFMAGGANTATVEWKSGYYDDVFFSSGTFTIGDAVRISDMIRGRYSH
jgi:hypothetical protein